MKETLHLFQANGTMSLPHFRAEGQGMTVNTWAANLSRRDATLTWVVKNQLCAGRCGSQLPGNRQEL